ncbi:methyltransferase, TIGR04325 family [Ignavibacterium sp.]|uniref:methyltransferase, TIGR04325 family n=1 Tax=Ignavibacterium sp. TaxID=2651167 RepID=UPI00307CD01A
MIKFIKKYIHPKIYKLFDFSRIAYMNKVYSTYDEAAKACGLTPYQEDELIQVILLKTKNFIQKLETDTISVWPTAAYSKISIINPIIENKKEMINVIDFGGACGAHYFHLRKIINEKVKFNWVVVETSKMVDYAKELENEELSFSNNLEKTINDMSEIDLLHTSGTLQCVDYPHKYLATILNSGSKWILFNRLGLNTSPSDVFTVLYTKLSWNGIGELPEGFSDKWISYPFAYLSEKYFINEVKKNYKIVAKYEESSGTHKVNKIETIGYGLLCKLKDYVA